MKKTIAITLAAALLSNASVFGVSAAENSAGITYTAGTGSNHTLSLSVTADGAESFEYQWYHASEENGAYTPIYKQTDEIYKIANDDVQTYIRAEVIPVYAGGEKGEAIVSDSYYISGIGRMSRTNYTTDRAQNKENPAGNFVSVAGENILILDEYRDADESFYVMSANFKGRYPFDADSDTSKFNVSDPNNIGYFLNNEFLTEGKQEGETLFTISQTMQKYISDHLWWTEAGASTSDCPEDYSQTAKIGLLSRSEYSKYWGRFGWDPNGDTKTAGWWLRSSRGEGVNTATADRYNAFVAMGSNEGYPNEGSNGWANTWNKATSSALYYMRPTYYISEDIFLNEKADIATMGDEVKQIFIERYTADELSRLYSVDELKQIGFEMSGATIVSDKTPVSALANLSVDYTDDAAVDYEYRWFRSDSADGPFEESFGTAESTYLVTTEDMHKYIKASVTPIYADSSRGETVETENSVYVEALGRISRSNYSTEEREQNKENPTDNFVKIGTESLLILNEYENPNEAFYVMTSGVKGRYTFDTDNNTKFDPDEPNNVAYFLNNEFLTDGIMDAGTNFSIDDDLQQYIPVHTWWTEAGNSGSNSPSDYSVEAKIGLLSGSEYQKYWGRFGWDPGETIKSGWWLRSGRGEGGTANSVMVALGVSNNYYSDKTSNSWANTWDRAANTAGTYYLRPVFYLNEDVFRELKAEVSTMGSEVKKMLTERYTADELAELYTAEELREIGFDVSDAVITADAETIGALTTLSAEYEDENAVSYRYQWQYLDGDEYKDIYKQTEKTYLISNEDKGRTLSVLITPVYPQGDGAAVRASNTIFVENLGKVGRTNYSAEEREANRDNPTENFFYAAGERLLLLDETNDPDSAFYVITAAAKCRQAFDPDNTSKFDITDENNLAYLLNNDFLDPDKGITDSAGNYTGTLSRLIIPYIDENHVWWTEPSGRSGLAEDYSYTGAIGLLSRSEYSKYWGKFGWDPEGAIKSGWWLRTARDTNDTNAYVAVGTSDTSASGPGNTWDKNANTTSYYVRPTFWLNDRFFLENKVEVSTMGSEIKKMLTERYTKDELKGLYTDAELGQIGFDTIVSVPDALNNIYTRSEAVFNIDYTAQDMGDLVITYSNGSESGEIREFLYPDDVLRRTVAMENLPNGKNDVTVTLKTSDGTVLSETKKTMYIVADQPEEKILKNGVVIHPTQLEQDIGLLETASKLGFSQVRIDFSWQSIETAEGVYDFSLFDTVMSEADRLGLEILPILDYNNTLYSDDGEVKGGINTDEERTAFVNYAAAVAQRYPQIASFEIWNEPNSDGFWLSGANAADYSALVSAVSDALYAINPEYSIYAGAIDVSKSPEAFTEAMFEEGLYDKFDALSYHPYFHPYGVNDSNSYYGADSFFEEVRIKTFNDIILDWGGFKDLAATEIGFNPETVTQDGESKKARETVKAIITSNAYNLDTNYVFNLKDEGEAFGVLNADLTPNELMYSISWMNSALADAKFLGRLDTSSTTYAYVFVKNNEAMAVCWSTNADTLSLGSEAKAYDLNGNEIEISNASIALSESPVYIYNAGSEWLSRAAANETGIRAERITERYPSVTEEVISAENAKELIMDDGTLSDADKSAALYMLYEMNMVNNIFNAVSNPDDLVTPAGRYEAVDTGDSIYSKAALKTAEKYLKENAMLENSALASKNNLTSANNAIINDLLESAEILGNGSDMPVSVSDVNVTDGILTFQVSGAENADVWVAVYDGTRLLSIEKAEGENPSCTVGNNGGKIFVWDGYTPLIDAVGF